MVFRASREWLYFSPLRKWGLCRGGLSPSAATSVSFALQCEQDQDSLWNATKSCLLTSSPAIRLTLFHLFCFSLFDRSCVVFLVWKNTALSVVILSMHKLRCDYYVFNCDVITIGYVLRKEHPLLMSDTENSTKETRTKSPQK